VNGRYGLGCALLLALALPACDGLSADLVTTNGSELPDAGGTAGNAGSAGSVTESWQIQLTGTPDMSFDVDRYELDLFALDEATVTSLHDAGRKLNCYVSVGTAEPWRSDFDELPEDAIGQPLANYPDERWLDVRAEGVRSVMNQRLMLAAATGCDAVELANLSAHRADSGFPLSYMQELEYATWLIEQAHGRGMAAGVSASDDLLPALAPLADWGLTDECLASDSCLAFQPFSDLGKPVFMIEYGSENDAPALCAEAAQLGFSLVIKRRALDAFRVGCPASSP